MYLFMRTLQPSPPTPGLRTTWIWYPYALLMLLFRWDANCCVWPHFVPNCDLFRIPHQQDISDAMQPSSSLSTHPMIHLTSMNHSVWLFTVVRGDSVIRRICSVDVERRSKAYFMNVCFRAPDGECNRTAAESDSSLKHKYKGKSVYSG